MQRKKYNAEQIIKIVQENILQGISAKQLAARYAEIICFIFRNISCIIFTDNNIL